MSATISRLLLTFSLVVAGPVAYTILFVTLMEIELFPFSYSNDEWALVVSDVVIGAAYAIGWIAIWWGELNWTAGRIMTTAAVFFGSIVVATGLAILFWAMTNEEEVACIFAGMLWAVFWMAGTALFWRESKSERAGRLSQAGVDVIACPGCGYNMTGLKTNKCPECGASYTVDQLFAATLEASRPEV